MPKKIKHSKITRRWENNPLTSDQKQLIEVATRKYIKDQKLEKDIPKDNIHTARKVLPYFSKYEPVWDQIDPDNLNKKKLPAHDQFCKVVFKTIKKFKRTPGCIKDSSDDEDDKPTVGHTSDTLANAEKNSENDAKDSGQESQGTQSSCESDDESENEYESSESEEVPHKNPKPPKVKKSKFRLQNNLIEQFFILIHHARGFQCKIEEA